MMSRPPDFSSRASAVMAIVGDGLIRPRLSERNGIRPPVCIADPEGLGCGPTRDKTVPERLHMLVDPSEHDERVAVDYTDETSTFGDRLVAARESMGMTQAQLAHRLGVKLQTLRNWEEDRSEPRANKLQMVAGMLNTSMVWLMSGQGAAPVPSRKAAPGSVGEDLITEFRAIHSDFVKLGKRIDRFEKQLAALCS